MLATAKEKACGFGKLEGNPLGDRERSEWSARHG